MKHIGIDQHKHFSVVAVLGPDKSVKRHKLYHDDKENIRDFFHHLEGIVQLLWKPLAIGIDSQICWKVLI